MIGDDIEKSKRVAHSSFQSGEIQNCNKIKVALY
jgi:hypothetical protein